MLDTDTRKALTQAVRDTAAREILPRFRNLSPGAIASKSSRHDLVTEADLRAEACLEAKIQHLLPGAFCLGEEKVSAEPALLERVGTEGILAIIDPVDGTWNFAHGIASFAVILAIMIDGKPAWGMIYDPVCDDWIEAAPGEGAVFHHPRGGARPLPRAGAEEIPTDRLNGFLPVRQFPHHLQTRLARAAYRFDQTLAIRSSAHEYRMMALGCMDFSVSSGTKPWDHVAGQIILGETGGAAMRLDGAPYEPLTDAPLICARSPEICQTVRHELDFLNKKDWSQPHRDG